MAEWSEALREWVESRGGDRYMKSYEAALGRVLDRKDSEDPHYAVQRGDACAVPGLIIWEDGSDSEPDEAEDVAWETLVLADLARAGFDV